MDRVKYKELMLDLSKLEPEELVALYVEAKTGLQNPLLEVPLYLQGTSKNPSFFRQLYLSLIHI